MKNLLISRSIELAILVLFQSSWLPAQSVHSPDGRLSLVFSLSEDARPMYQLSFGNREVLKPGCLDIQLKDDSLFTAGLEVAGIESTSVDNAWEPVWGEVSRIRNNYHELAVDMKHADGRPGRLIIRFRLFNDGLGFRYEFPRGAGLEHFIVAGEGTEFRLTGDHKAFWIPGDYDTNEYKYSTTRLSEVDALQGRKANEIYARSIIGANAVQTPLMMKSDDGLYMNIHEAALVNYPAMQLEIDRTKHILRSHLVPDAVGNRAYLQTPCTTPWRTVIVSDRAEDILASKMILNLNEPSKIGVTDWIRPMKYVGIWWELHIGKTTWNYADTGNVSLSGTDWNALRPNGRHGATTARTKRYIDFAAEHRFDGVLVEGWDIGWEDWFGKWKEEVFDFVTPYPDFDVEELQRYAAPLR
jgi:hypothetical protein